MTLLKDNNYKEINVALLSLEADIKNKITNFDTSAIDKQLVEINSRIDKINAGGSSSSSDEIEDINSKLNSNSTKIKNIERNIEGIDTKIDGIEQKLSDIFSAESKVTDFNTTINSGIYYWVIDAANRPTDYGVLLVNKYDGGDSTSSLWVNQIAYGTNNKIYFRQNINSTGWPEWQQLVTDSNLSPYYHKCIYARTNTTGAELVKTLALEDGKCYTIEGYQGDNYRRTRVYFFSGAIRTIDEITSQANPFSLSYNGNVLTITFANWSYNQCRIYEESPANNATIG